MGIKVAINGYGRIGRQVVRAIFDYKLQDQLDIVAINASGSIETNAHLTKFDTVHGRFDADVSHDENTSSSTVKNPLLLHPQSCRIAMGRIGR